MNAINDEHASAFREEVAKQHKLLGIQHAQRFREDKYHFVTAFDKFVTRYESRPDIQEKITAMKNWNAFEKTFETGQSFLRRFMTDEWKRTLTELISKAEVDVEYLNEALSFEVPDVSADPDIRVRLERLQSIRQDYEDFPVRKNSTADKYFSKSLSSSSNHTLSPTLREPPEPGHLSTEHSNRLRKDPDEEDESRPTSAIQQPRILPSTRPNYDRTDDQYDDSQNTSQEQQTWGQVTSAEPVLVMEDDQGLQDTPGAAVVSNSHQDDAEPVVELPFKVGDKALGQFQGIWYHGEIIAIGHCDTEGEEPVIFGAQIPPLTTLEGVGYCILCTSVPREHGSNPSWVIDKDDHSLMKKTPENMQLAADLKTEAVIKKLNELSEAVRDLERAIEDNTGASDAKTVVKRIKVQLSFIKLAYGAVDKARLEEAGVTDVTDHAERVLRMGSKRKVTVKRAGTKGVMKKRG